MYWPLLSMYSENFGFGLGGFVVGRTFHNRMKGLLIYRSIYLSIHPSIYLSIYLPTYIYADVEDPYGTYQQKVAPPEPAAPWRRFG